MDSDPIQEDAREARRGRRVGPGAVCERCGERDVRTLKRYGKRVLCYEHRRLETGDSPMEKHHPMSKSNSERFVVIPGNDHRVLNEYQRAWPLGTLRNPDESPLLRAAAAIRGWLDVLHLLAERIVGWIPEWLEQLDAWLRRRLGSRWWKEFEEEER
jgi:hypothetical protein